MRLLKTLMFVVIVLAAIVGLLWYAGDRLEPLDNVIRVGGILTPDSAGADNSVIPPDDAAETTQPAAAAPAAEPPGEPPTIIDGIKARLGRIKLGMTCEEVDEVLGQCTLAKTEYASDGACVRTAVWMYDNDMVGVRFRNGKVAMVVGGTNASVEPARAR